MAKGGQPTKYRPEYCEMLKEHMAKGFPYETFAAAIGVHRDTLYQWEKDQPEFSDAKKRARELNYKTLTEIGMAAMTGQILITTSTRTRTTMVNKKPVTVVEETKANGFQSAPWIFFMKNIHGWRDQVDFNEDDQVDSMDFGEEENA